MNDLGELYMNENRDNVISSFNKTCYYDKYGYCSLIIKSMSIVADNTEYNENQIYIKKDKLFYKVSYIKTHPEINGVSHDKFDYSDVLDSFTNGKFYLNSRTSLNKNINDVISFRNEEYMIPIKINYFKFNIWIDNRECNAITITFNKETGFDDFNIVCLSYNENNPSFFISPIEPRQVTIGKECCIQNVGTCIVTKLYSPEYNYDVCMNEFNLSDTIHGFKFCEVKTINGERYDLFYIDDMLITKERFKVCLTPKDLKNELEIFNDSINEVLLSPFIKIDNCTHNMTIFWEKIEEAACYCVSQYRVTDSGTNYSRVPHFIKNYHVDRDECFLTIRNMDANETYIFVVVAENRNRDIISKSRGIINEKPQWFIVR